MSRGQIRNLLLLGCLILGLAACRNTPGPVLQGESDSPPEVLYREAIAQLQATNYQEAAQGFADVERRHPYSRWAARAQLMAAYAYYLDLRFDEAILLLDRFLRLYPGNEQVSYAYYLRAMSLYDQINEVRRDQTIAQESLTAFQLVIDRFPQSEYARDAAYKIDLTYDQLAGKEMSIARWYQKEGEYGAALGRFKRVIDLYQTTNHTPEALHRLTETYLKLGLVNEAQATASVLGHNYPSSPWYIDSYLLLLDVAAVGVLQAPDTQAGGREDISSIAPNVTTATIAPVDVVSQDTE